MSSNVIMVFNLLFYSYEDLMMEEGSVSAELDSYSKKFENWSNLKHTTTHQPSARKLSNANIEEEKLPEEVTLFEVAYTGCPEKKYLL